MKRLGISLLNISEGRNTKTIEAVASAAVSSSQDLSEADKQLGLKSKSTVLNIFSDYDYNRSVLTIAAPLQHLKYSVYNACKEAYNLIDLSQQIGVHPRLGSVDLLPIYPLSGDVSVEECGLIATDIASNLANDIPGTSFFLFGTADVPNQRDLVARRQQVGWFLGQHEMDYGSLKQDIGCRPSRRYGLTGAGGSLYVTNYNVSIGTQDVSIGQEIARKIRSSTPGGLPGVKVMAFDHEGSVEIACNVENITSKRQSAESGLSGDSPTAVSSVPDVSLQQNLYDQVSYTSPAVIEGRVKELAGQHGVSLIRTSIIGFTPQEAHQLAVYALQTGQTEFWRTRVAGATM